MSLNSNSRSPSTIVPATHASRSEALRVLEDTMTSIMAGSKSQLIVSHMKRYYDMVRTEADSSKLKQEFIFNSLILSVEMNRSKITDKILRCLQKLVDLGVLRVSHDLEFSPVATMLSPGSNRMGSFVTPQMSSSLPPIVNLDIFVEYLCNSRKISTESSQISLIRFLRCLVASNECDVHDYALMKILQTFFTLAHVVTKYPNVQAAAKENLERIVYLIQYRLDRHLNSLSIPSPEPASSPPGSPPFSGEEGGLSDDMETPSMLGERNHLVPSAKENPRIEKYCRDIIYQMVESIFKPPDDAVSNLSDEATSTMTTRLPEYQFQNKDDFMLSEDPEVKSWAPAIRDTYNMMLSFCRVLKKTGSEGSADAMTYLERSKFFCLETIQAFLLQKDDDFYNLPFFIHLTKNHLSQALAYSVISATDSSFKIISNILTILITKMRHHQKSEVGAFISHCFLRILDSPNSPDKHRVYALESLKKICAIPEFPVELYMNYDCNISAENVFHSLLSALERVIRGTGVKIEDADANSEIITHAIEVVTLLTGSLAKWMKRGSQVTFRKKEPAADGSIHPELLADFEADKKKKDNFSKCVEEFKKKPKKGVSEFIRHGFVVDNAEELAHFLRYTPMLDKVALGEYLGEGDEANVHLLKLFVGFFDFANMTFDNALRYYLTAFRLPGEAQKISRYLEFFSEKFCQDNPTLFSNKDTAYVLSYSVIMLNTDAHNPMVKKKMMLEEFIRNNRGIDNGRDVPAAYLEQLYRSIVNNEIKMKEMEEPKGLSGLSPAKKKSAIYNWESERACQKIMESVNGSQENSSNVFHEAQCSEFTKTIFSLYWSVVLGCLNHRFMKHISSEDSRIASYIAHVMEGFKFSVKICLFFNLETERTVLLNSYTSFFLPPENRVARRGDSSERGTSTLPADVIKTILGDEVVDEKFMKTYFPTAKPGKVEYTRLQENLEKMNRIQKQFIGKRLVKIFDPMRRFIREGPVRFFKHGMMKQKYMFMFDDCIIYASPVPVGGERLYFLNRLLFLAQCRISEYRLLEPYPYLAHISHPEKSFLFGCEPSTQLKTWFTDLEKAISISTDFSKASETSLQTAYASIVSAVTCLNFECEKPNKRSQEMERRIMQIDYSQQKLLNILKGTIRKTFAFVDIVSCDVDALTETIVNITLRNSVHYEIHSDTRDERDEMIDAIRDLITFNSKAVPSKFKLGECMKRGVIEKQIGRNWTKIWALLYRGKLLLYKSQQDFYPLHVIPVNRNHVECSKIGDLQLDIGVMKILHPLRFRTKTERNGWFSAISDAAKESCDTKLNPSVICAAESACYPVFKVNKRGVLQMRVFQIDFANKHLSNLSEGDSHKQWTFNQISEFKSNANEKNIQIFFREFHHYEIIVPHMGDFKDLCRLLQIIISNAAPTMPRELGTGILVRKGYIDVQYSGHAMSSCFAYLYDKKFMVFNNDYEMHPLTVIQMRDVRNITKSGSSSLDLAHQSSLSIRCENETDRDNWYAHFVSTIRKIATMVA